MTEVQYENVSFGYKSDAIVLNDINLDLHGPGLVCIIGPNGVGKSTLVRCMNKLVVPSSGRVTINGCDVADMNLKEISSIIGYVPAVSADLFSMPVIDTILIGRHNHQTWRTTEADLEIVRRVMKLLDLESFAMRPFNQLSAGQHQKVAIARGLVQETPALVLDEPTSNLDVRHQVYITELLRGIAERQDKLVIMISHDLNIAARYAHQIVMMSEPGVIHSVGEPQEVITEDSIREVYGVDCEVVDFRGSPHVMLGSAL